MGVETRSKVSGNGKGRKIGVLLLGHGSKAPEANETLRKVAASVERAGGYGYVLPAFLQMERPDFQEAVDMMVGKGFSDITVMPYFLYPGLHVTKDLPEEITTATARHPGLRISVTGNLGFHDKLVDIAIERIDEAKGERGEAVESTLKAPSQHPIEAESFRIISEELGANGFSERELPIVKRVIHATADFEFKEVMRFSGNAIEAGIRAIRAGRNIVTDVRMVEAGVTTGRLKPFGVRVYSFSSDRDVIEASAERNTTRTAASMAKAAPFLEGGIAAVGNAPTALVELIRLVKEGAARPALIVGTPVGFVGARESKEELLKSGCEYITTIGRKGGSTVAAAIVNALAIEAAGAAV